MVYADPEQVQQASRRLNRTQYPWRLANCGDFDLCGFPKPQLAFKRIVWGSKETYLAVHNPCHPGKAALLDRYAWPDCGHTWTWHTEPGTPVEVEVYSSADEVELILNGASLGRVPAKIKTHFNLTYQPGTLEAVSYTDGKEVSRDRLVSAGIPAALKLIPEKTDICADGESLCFVKVEAVDAQGNPVPYVEEAVIAEVEGAAVLAAFGTGRGCTEENYTTGRITLYKGTALAILRASTEAGTAILRVSADGLHSAAVALKVQ